MYGIPYPKQCKGRVLGSESTEIRREVLWKLNRFGRTRQTDKRIQGTVLRLDSAGGECARPRRLSRDSTTKDAQTRTWSYLKRSGEDCKTALPLRKPPGDASGATCSVCEQRRHVTQVRFGNTPLSWGGSNKW